MIKFRLPILASLLLSDLAERRGKGDEEVLVDLIRQAAITELEPKRGSLPGQAVREVIGASPS